MKTEKKKKGEWWLNRRCFGMIWSSKRRQRNKCKWILHIILWFGTGNSNSKPSTTTTTNQIGLSLTHKTMQTLKSARSLSKGLRFFFLQLLSQLWLEICFFFSEGPKENLFAFAKLLGWCKNTCSLLNLFAMQWKKRTERRMYINDEHIAGQHSQLLSSKLCCTPINFHGSVRKLIFLMQSLSQHHFKCLFNSRKMS